MYNEEVEYTLQRIKECIVKRMQPISEIGYKLDNNNFKNLVGWRCQDEGSFIDNIRKEEKCLKVYIDC